MRLVLATRNEHKLRELGRMMDGVMLEPLPEDVALPPEDGATFAANALGKARAAAAAIGRPAIADDSGIEAAALGGAPGPQEHEEARVDGRGEEEVAEVGERRERGLLHAPERERVVEVADAPEQQARREQRPHGPLATNRDGAGRRRARP